MRGFAHHSDNRINSANPEDMSHDLLIVHMVDSSVKFDVKRTRHLRLEDHPNYSRLIAHELPGSYGRKKGEEKELLTLPDGMVLQFKVPRAVFNRHAVIEHTILHKCRVDVGSIGNGYWLTECAYPVGEIDIWFVASHTVTDAC